MTKLRYVGDGTGLSGFPARDLDLDDLKRLADKPYVQRRYGKSIPALVKALLAARIGEAPIYTEVRPAAKPSSDGEES
jgi:hypothetical protein